MTGGARRFDEDTLLSARAVRASGVLAKHDAQGGAQGDGSAHSGQTGQTRRDCLTPVPLQLLIPSRSLRTDDGTMSEMPCDGRRQRRVLQAGVERPPTDGPRCACRGGHFVVTGGVARLLLWF